MENFDLNQYARWGYNIPGGLGLPIADPYSPISNDKKQTEYEKAIAKRSLFSKQKIFTPLKSSKFIVEFGEIPFEIINGVNFLGKNTIEIIFEDVVEFCVEDYIKEKFDILKNQKINIKYLDDRGCFVKSNEYIPQNIVNIRKDALTVKEENNLEIKITLECKEDDTSTDKE